METKKKIKSKGDRLNWIPLEKSTRVRLDELKPVGRKLKSDVVKRNDWHQIKQQELLIP
jgi:hypothetical protein